MPAIVPSFLLRAPALPAGEVPQSNPIVEAALALAGPGARDPKARARYLARMAFRPTPDRLFAGVAVGQVGDATAIDTRGEARAHLHVRYALLAGTARALLDDPDVRRRVRLRVAPSLLRDGPALLWLKPGPRAEAHVERAHADAVLDAVLDATARGFTPWSRVRAAAAKLDPGADPAALDEYLLVLRDDGLLVDDLTPPLIGRPPLDALVARLAEIPAARSVFETLVALQQELAEAIAIGDPRLPLRIAGAADRITELPVENAGGSRAAIDAVLEMQPAAATLDEVALRRAARAARAAMRLQNALGGTSTWERATGPALDEAVRTLVEHHEPGPFHPAGLALGRYAVLVGDPPAPPIAGGFPSSGEPARAPRAIPPALLARLASALAAGGDEIALGSDEIEDLAPPCDEPPTFELVLAPARERAGAPPGDGWLLGVHGPAGASWGRFAHALGSALMEAVAELRAAEARALPGVRVCDLQFAPGAEVADVACRPALRPDVVALTGWPAIPDALPPAALDLVLGPRLAAGGVQEAPAALTLRERASGDPIELLPLQRIRAATIEDDGVHRLLAGFGLQRASYPWALHPGPFAAIDRLPRITIDGFVVAPASFRLPDDIADRDVLARWRAQFRSPNSIQAGDGDRMLPVDLDAPDAAATLARLGAASRRAFEIWPPQDRLADADGRRVEAIVAVVNPAPRTDSKTYLRGAIVDPRPDPDVATFKLHGAPDRADRVLLRGVAPAIESALARGEIAGWFFQRYVDERGRHHLRLRARGNPAQLDRFARRLTRTLAPLRDAGDLLHVERGDYLPERLRFGPALPLVEAVFQHDSAHVLALLALDGNAPDGPELLVRHLDALAAGLGLPLAARAALAAAGRAARTADLPAPTAVERDPLAPLFRARQAALASALRADAGRAATDDPATLAFRAHRTRLADVAREAARARLAPALRRVLPDLLHLASVRLAGPVAAREAVAFYLWQRTLEGLLARRR